MTDDDGQVAEEEEDASQESRVWLIAPGRGASDSTGSTGKGS